MPTCPSSFSALALASPFETSSLIRMGSVSWLPIVNDGSRLDIGS